MFELPQQDGESRSGRGSGLGERAVLVHVALQGYQQETSVDDALDELTALAESAGAVVLECVKAVRGRPDPRYFVGSGKAEELADVVRTLRADLVIFDHSLSPSQERNLERLVQCRVLDRSGLILDIFAQRARSFEGKLQVELAQLRHISTRLVRGWTHLERQKGGIGLRGPGETQLETDRRLLAVRIKQLRRRLDKVENQRDQGRQGRRRASIPTLALVGYTNAGKSTLFNRMTGAEVYSADQLFATLDPTLRRLELGDETPVVLADTVGFIDRLPHELVKAFQSTLQETAEADMLLHVVDASDPQRRDRRDQVETVLEQINAHELPTLLVYNKCDLSGDEPRILRDEHGAATQVWLSAVSGEGMELLQQVLLERFRDTLIHTNVRLPASAGKARSRLFELGEVLNESFDEEGASLIELRIPRNHLQDWGRKEGLNDLLEEGLQEPTE